jgi:hypothetical protein
MNDAVGVIEVAPKSGLKIFIVKVFVVTWAVVIVGFLAAFWIEDMFKGGHEFWGKVEMKLHRIADAPDLPPQKKAEIIASLKKLSAKYRPYFDALNGEK